MTRKTALHKALTEVSDNPVKEKLKEILEDLPLNGWSEKRIFDSIEQFIEDEGRIPTAYDFRRKGLPSHPIIKHYFGITLAEFLDKYYKKEEQKVSSKIYGHKSKEEWLEVFKAEFNRIKPSSAEKYNKLRTKGTPSWAAIARFNDITYWLSLLDLCKLEPITEIRKKGSKRKKTVHNLKTHIRHEELLEAFNKENPPLDIKLLKKGILQTINGDFICKIEL